MQIKAIDPIRATDAGRNIYMEPGDVLTVGDEFGQLACSMGWAEDLSGAVPTGEKRSGPVEISPQNLASDSAI